MKTLTALLVLSVGLALIPVSAQAAAMPDNEIRGMLAQIDAVMDSGLCAVANDTANHSTETMTVILRQRGRPPLKRDIPVNDYNWMRSSNYQRTPDGRWRMSVNAEQVCRADAVGGRCLAFRTFFQRFFPDVSPPGPGVRLTPI